jgi:hypothetical protein
LVIRRQAERSVGSAEDCYVQISIRQGPHITD